MNHDRDDEQNNSATAGTSSESTRRDALRALGLMAGAAATMLATKSASAQVAVAKPVKALPSTMSIDINKASLADLKLAVQLSTRLPTTTPITDMRISKDDLVKLTPAARKLTKADLVALGQVDLGINVPLSPAADALTVKDIRSIRSVFTNVAGLGGGGGLAAADVSCCCCTPCCCAAAVVGPERSLS